MRDAKLFFCLASILLLSTKSCDGLCKLENSTMARCHDLEDAKYIDTYDLEILKTSVNEDHLRGEMFHNLSSLRKLDLSYGEILEIDARAFADLLDLQSIDLSHNRINSVPPTLFDDLKKLRNLNLRRNALVEIPDAVLNVKNLKTLDLTGNPLNCNCATLKARDALLERRVHLSSRILCSSPANLKRKSLLKPDAQVICMFEEQDKEMQMDQPEIDGSGDGSTEVHLEQPKHGEFSAEEEIITEMSVAPMNEEIETPAPTKSAEFDEAPLSESSENGTVAMDESTTSPSGTSTSSDEVSFSEEKLSSASTTASIALTEKIVEASLANDTESPPQESSENKEVTHPVEGSGTEDEPSEGSGIEGSGAGVPSISWDVPDDDATQETSSPEPAKTTDAGLLDMIWGVLWSTSASPEEDTKKELRPEDEEFINVTSEPTTSLTEKTTVREEVIVPSVITDSEGTPVKSDGDTRESAVEVGHILDESKSGKVKADDLTKVEASDASATRQPKKGMGSYVVLAALLAILAILIGFAAYKGDFCRKRRKREDPERGTELKDMTKSLLDSSNTNQAKISPNGNLENVPLVTESTQDDSKIRDDRHEPIKESPEELTSRYSGMAPDVIDPIKPPRKSYTSQDEPEGVMKNGRSHQDLVKSSIPTPEINEPVQLRKYGQGEPAINGKNPRDSVSSLGTESRDSPSVKVSPRVSSPTNGSLGTTQPLARPPLSPGAQRVKITLQENPDSVPRTPILITRTKAGENLVKTP